ncbi:MAG TPA: hypothetical protein ENJ95_23705 [Bacteroidetes bacterium]|nr:hypothetical protein [Bacteroidota bacterium]
MLAKEIEAFDKKIEDLLKSEPDDKTLNTIVFCKKHWNKMSYYGTLDTLCYSLGLVMLMVPCFSKKEKLIGFLPGLKFHKGNKLKKPEGEIHFSIHPMSSLKCYKQVAKELIYRLQRFGEIEKYIPSSS